MRPRLLDLFCGAGGAAMGYHRAGFDVLGVDIAPQPHYPFAFLQGDALEYLGAHGAEYDVIHASPPCQAYCPVNQQGARSGKRYPDLVTLVRAALQDASRLYIIENVIGAPLRGAVRLCGSSFGLPIRRHRLFESSVLLFMAPCQHGWQEATGSYPTCWRPRSGRRPRSRVVQVYGHTAGKHLWPAAMGIDWMTRAELSQAIPPAYTEYLGRQLLRALEGAR
jgi:DNA (cytosine-5)-methyltransferase 1